MSQDLDILVAYTVHSFIFLLQEGFNLLSHSKETVQNFVRRATCKKLRATSLETNGTGPVTNICYGDGNTTWE